MSATTMPTPSNGLRRIVMKTVTALIFVGIITSARPAHAIFGIGDIVYDPSVWAQTLATAEEMVKTVQQAKQTYLLMNAVYQGVKNWQQFGWVELLDMVDMPFFDGVDGIDDLRDLATMTEMSVDELMTLFAEAQTITRLMNDPAFRASQTRAKQVQLLNEAHQRMRRRKVIFARALKKEQREMDKLKQQARDVQTQIILESSKNPASQASIEALSAKLQVIGIRQQTLKESLWAMMKKDELAANHEEETLRSMMREAGLKDTTIEVHDAMQITRNFLGIPDDDFVMPRGGLK